MTKPRLAFHALCAAACLSCAAAGAQTFSNGTFVNGMVLSGGLLDQSSGTAVERRVGFFSDIYYDRSRNEWWGLSDRGPGGGLLSYETRVQRFTLDIAADGSISNFGIAQTVKFTSGGQAFNGLAPSAAGTLGSSFDPEGLVVNPRNGNLLVSDEYGPSLYEFSRSGEFIRAFTVPSNLIPRVGGSVNYNAGPLDSSNALTSGREPNRGFEGLAISPDGQYAYAMLQNGTIQDGWSAAGGGTRGQYTRIVKFDTSTGQAVGQYAYKLESSGQGRGISSLVALGNDKFLVLERNNRGVGVGATVASPDKNVFAIDLTGAADVTGVNLPASGSFAGAVSKNTTAVLDLDANTLSALGNKSPEKWEGLAIGPKLANGKYVVLAGTDNDYSVTQSGTGTQYDVYMRFSDADPYAASIQCPIGSTTGCFLTSNNATAATLTADYQLLPGVLHSYTADIPGYVAAVPEPATWAVLLTGLLGVSAAARSRRR
jgi:hypothetical protein